MRKIIIVFVFICLFSIVFAEEFIFRDYFYYDNIEYLYKRGLINIDINNIPLRKSEIKKSIYSLFKTFANKNISFNETDRKVIKELYEDLFKDNNLDLSNVFSIGEKYSDSIYFNFKNIISLSLNSDFYSLSLSGKTEYPFDFSNKDTIRERVWRNSSTIISKGYGGIYNGENYIIIGKFLPAWGQGLFDNLFISRNTYSYNGLLFNVNIGYTDFTFFTTSLSPYNSVSINNLIKTYASFHKLTFHLPFSSNIVFKEIIIYPSQSIQLKYVNPFVPYYMIQWNAKTDDNIIWALEYNSHFIRKIPFSCELFIDDYQYDKNAIGGPNKLGWNINTSFSLFNIIFNFEYTKIMKWTGTHEYTNLEYKYYNNPILYSLGPDSDLRGIRVDYFYKQWQFYYTLAYIRKGEGTIDLSYEIEGGTMYPPFPSGIVKSNLRNRIDINYKVNKYFYIKSYILYESIKNENNILNQNNKNIEIAIIGEVKL